VRAAIAENPGDAHDESGDQDDEPEDDNHYALRNVYAVDLQLCT
jgi:hypothetical protein